MMPARQVAGKYVQPTTTNKDDFYYCEPETWRIWEKYYQDPLVSDIVRGNVRNHLRRHGSAGLVMETGAGVDALNACDVCRKYDTRCRLDIDALDKACALCYFMDQPPSTCNAVPPEPGPDDHAVITSHLVQKRVQSSPMVTADKKRKRISSENSSCENRDTRMNHIDGDVAFRHPRHAHQQAVITRAYDVQNYWRANGVIKGRRQPPFTPAAALDSPPNRVPVHSVDDTATKSAGEACAQLDCQVQDHDKDETYIKTISPPASSLHRQHETCDSRDSQLEAKQKERDRQVSVEQNNILAQVKPILEQTRTVAVEQTQVPQAQGTEQLNELYARLCDLENKKETRLDLQARVQELEMKDDHAPETQERIESLEAALQVERQQRVELEARVNTLEASMETMSAQVLSDARAREEIDESVRKRWLVDSYFA